MKILRIALCFHYFRRDLIFTNDLFKIFRVDKLSQMDPKAAKFNPRESFSINIEVVLSKTEL